MPFKLDNGNPNPTPEVIQYQSEKDGINNFLYGAGYDGWNENWFDTLKKAYEDNRLLIASIYPEYQNERSIKEAKLRISLMTNYHKKQDCLTRLSIYQQVNMIFARKNLKEEDLTDQERLLLMINCHPIECVSIGAPITKYELSLKEKDEGMSFIKRLREESSLREEIDELYR